MTEVVGKVAVKVIPDTKGFRQRLQSELQKIERGLHVDIEINLDDDGLKARAKQIREEVQKAMKDVKINVDLDDQASLRSAMRQLDRELQKLDEVELKVELDRESLTAAKQLLREQLDKTTKDIRDHVEAQMRDIPVTVGINNEGSQQRLNQLRRELEEKFEKIAELEAHITPELDQLERRRVQREIDKLTEDVDMKIKPEISSLAANVARARLSVLARDRIVQLIPVVSKTAAARAGSIIAALSGARIVDKYLTRVRDSLSELDRNAFKFANIKLGLLNIAGYALTAASNIFAAGRSIVQMAQASAALPGILAGLAIGLAATVAVLKDFNKVLPEVGKKFHALQDEMSTKFWAEAEKPFRNMVTKLFPSMSAGLKRVSTSLGRFFGAFATDLTKELGGGVLRRMFNDLSVSIQESTKHTGSFARIIRLLGEHGAEQLPRLAGWFGDLSDRFAEFLTQAHNDGRLDNWIETGITQIKEFGRLIKGFWGTFTGLAKAAEAAGGSTLTMMADTMESVSKAVNSADFQEKLTGAFQGAHEAMHNIATDSGPAFKKLIGDVAVSLKDLLPLAGDTLGIALRAIFTALDQPAITFGVEQMLLGLRDAFLTLEPVLIPVGAAIGAIMVIIGELLRTIAPILGTVFESLAGSIIRLTPVILDLIDILGPVLGAVVDALVPILAAVGDVIIQIWNESRQPLMALAAQIADLATRVGPPLAEFVSILGKYLIAAIPPVLELAVVALPVFTDALVAVLNVINWVTDAVVNLVNKFPVLGGGLTGLVSVFKQLPGVGPAITGFFEKSQTDAIATSNSFGTASAAIDGMGLSSLNLQTNLSTLGTTTALPTVGLNGIDPANAQSRDLMVHLATLGKTQAKPAVYMQGVPGFVGNTTTMTGLLQKLGKQTANPKVQVDPASFGAARTALTTTLPAAMKTGSTATAAEARALNSSIVSALSNLPSKLGSIGKNAGQSLASGLASAIPAATSSANKLVAQADRAARARAQINSPSKVFREIGLGLGEGLIQGMDRSQVATAAAASDLMGVAIDAAPTLELFHAGADAITSLVSGMESKYSSVTRSLDGLSSSMADVGLTGSVEKRVFTAAAGDLAATGTDGAPVNQLNYYAAETAEVIDSEEALFEAAQRARMVFG
jgi:phage-related protein